MRSRAFEGIGLSAVPSSATLMSCSTRYVLASPWWFVHAREHGGSNIIRTRSTRGLEHTGGGYYRERYCSQCEGKKPYSRAASFVFGHMSICEPHGSRRRITIARNCEPLKQIKLHIYTSRITAF